MAERTNARTGSPGGLIWAPCAVLILGSIVVLLPWRECFCRRPDWDFFGPFEAWDVSKLQPLSVNCPVCLNDRRISPWREWTYRPPVAD